MFRDNFVAEGKACFLFDEVDRSLGEGSVGEGKAFYFLYEVHVDTYFGGSGGWEGLLFPFLSG